MNRVLIADISKYQMHDDSNVPISFEAMYVNDVRGVILRACVTSSYDGIPRKDDRVDQYTDWLLEYNGKHPDQRVELVGYYAAIRLERALSPQCDVFLDAVQDKPKVRRIVDLEGAEPYGYGPPMAGMRLGVYCSRVGIDMIYTRASWFDDYIAAGNWAEYDLWIARYPGTLNWYTSRLSGPWSDDNYQPRDWNDWTLWQFSKTGPGTMLGVESLGIDLDYFNGSYAQFLSWLKHEQPTSLEDRVSWLEQYHPKLS